MAAIIIEACGSKSQTETVQAGTKRVGLVRVKERVAKSELG